MTGTVINALAVLVGGLLGLILRNRLPARIQETIMHGIGLIVMVIGIQMASSSENIILPLMAVVSGGIAGEALNVELWLQRLGDRAQRQLGGEGTFSQGFVAASLLYIVGPMAIMGSIDDGLRGDYAILLTKSMLDGLSAIALAATFGLGVLFSAAPVFVYQGLLTLGAGLAKGILSAETVTEMTATGGILIVAIGVNILQLRKIRVGNLLPALVFIVAIVKLVGLF